MIELEPRVSHLESLVEKLVYAQFNTDIALNKLSAEMREFKDEMKEFKDEMKEFKDEMRDFKGEMQDFKGEMQDFKGEMQDFKGEMQDFKGEMQDFKNETRMQMKDMNKKWGDLANKMGTFAEDIATPNLERIAREELGLGDPIDKMRTRTVYHPEDRSRVREYDGLLFYDNCILFNETKSNAKLQHINELMTRVNEFTSFLPQYAGLPIIPVFSAMHIPDNMLVELNRKKIYALAMGDYTMNLLNLKEVGLPEL